MTDPLALMRDRFRARVVADRAELEQLATGDLTSAALRRLVHNLAGVAGTFGYGSISAAAIEIDNQMSAGEPAALDSLDRLKERLDEVARPAG